MLGEGAAGARSRIREARINRRQLEPGERRRIVHRYEISYPGDTLLTAQR